MQFLYEEDVAARARAAAEARGGGRGRKGAAGPTAGRKIRDQCGARQGRKRVIQSRFNVVVLEAIPKRKASTL